MLKNVVGADGFEPPVSLRTDLQSARLPITGYAPNFILCMFVISYILNIETNIKISNYIKIIFLFYIISIFYILNIDTYKIYFNI